jgi:GNAT superfamily N-acetyltransferase
MRPSDVPHLLDIFHHLSVESRYLRFNLPLADPDPAWLQKEAERMADVPPDQGGAWLAFVDLPEEGQTCIGGVRYIYVGNKKAEVALTVRDDLQGLGIGTAMLGFIGRRCPMFR